nr:MAG TPA: terminase large subunit [Caudoviricetes sp.]
MEDLSISDKQRHAIGLLLNRSIVEIFMGGSGGGPQPLDSIVKTPTGDMAIGELKVGDKVLTYTGDVQEVIDIPYEGKGSVFEITLKSGRKVQAEESHLFPFKLAGSKRPELLQVKDYVYAFSSWKEEKQPELYVSENGRIWSEKITSHKFIGQLPVRCISVSNLDGLYLTNNNIVTHNSKTFTMAIMVLLCIRQFPGCRLFVGRKTLKSLRQSFIQTLLGQVHPMFGLVEEDFHYSAQLGEIKYSNGSMVIFGELMKNPSDPDFTRFGSLEIDVAFIEEAGEVSLEAKNAIRSRVGRGVMAQKWGIPGKLVLSGNPSQNFLRTEYYDPYMELGGGEYRSWTIGHTTAKEFRGNLTKTHKIEMKRCFLRMSVYQNPFIPQSYIDTLKTLPRRERKRLLDGDWDYVDDDSSLFKSGLIDKAITYELPQPGDKFNKVIGVDVSDAGRDRTVFSLIDNGVLVTQKCSEVQMNWDRNSEEPLSYLIANELIEFAQRNGFQQVNAKNIAVESNGVGVGVRDALRVRGWTLTEYVNTGQSRSDNYYNLMLNMDSGTIKIYKDVSTLGELRKELGAHTYEMENQQPKVIKKSKLKEVLGHSPDYSDSFMIASWMWDRKVNPQRDPKRNSKRISW